jgi:uncharacterized membrane protein YphA (DoxX/SURF4 family)
MGITALAECGLYFSSARIEPRGAVAGLLLAASGSLLLIGLWTQIASAVFGFVMLATSISWAGRPAVNPIESPLAALFAITIAISIVLLGPGSVSLDSRLFGPREIIIPAANHRS